MDKKTQKFIEDYKKTIDTEYKLFDAEFQRFAYEGEPQSRKVVEKLDQDVKDLQWVFKAQKSNLASYDLTPAQAKEILQQKPQEAHIFEANGIHGSDCYRFFNRELRSNPEVALEAVKQDPNSAKHLPEQLKERLQGPNPEASLQAMCYADKLYGQLGRLQSQTKTLSMSR